MFKIIILDDHPVIIEALKFISKDSQKINLIKGVTTENELLQYLNKKNDIHCVLLDLNLESKRDGVAVCKTIKKQFPDLKVIIFSSFSQKSLVLNSLKNGADGFLLKNANIDEIILSIENVMDGKIYLDRNLGNIFSTLDKKDTFNYIPKLTRREKEVLKLIVEENTSAEISEKLFISISTVETHRANIFSKTGVKNMAELIKIALEKNLLDN